MDLVPYMYYEAQEAGSQLCAQHCLYVSLLSGDLVTRFEAAAWNPADRGIRNNLLQQNTYTEFDLADIAHKLDQAENAALSASRQNKKSYNFDDTGFFSISVLERALQVWDMTLVRWRGEAMKPYQEHPEDEAAFILNLSSHWIPLRRFSPSPPNKGSTKRWYNLNSFLPGGPEWISPTYLRLVLTQAEKEGYSVFVIRKAGSGNGEGLDTEEGEGWGDGGIGILPECTADRMAVELGEPMGRNGGPVSPGGTNGSSGVGPSRMQLASTNTDQPTVDEPTSSPAGLSSPPARRRKRQEDLIPSTIPDDFALGQPIRPARNATRVDLSPRDVLDDQTGTFPADPADEREEGEEEDAAEPYQTYNYRALQDEMYSGPTDFALHSRSYDDEDAALQAALKASMDDLPPDWVAPEVEAKEKVTKKPAPAPPPLLTTKPVAAPPVTSPGAAGSNFKEEIEAEDEDVQTEPLSADEIRRRRLARFGPS